MPGQCCLTSLCRTIPVFFRFTRKPKIRFQSLCHPELNDWPNITSHDYKVIRIPDQSNVGTTVRTIFIFMKGPVKLMQKNIGKASLPRLGGGCLCAACAWSCCHRRLVPQLDSATTSESGSLTLGLAPSLSGELSSPSPLSLWDKSRPAARVRLPCMGGRSYMLNEQLTRPTPCSRIDQPGFVLAHQSEQKVNKNESNP